MVDWTGLQTDIMGTIIRKLAIPDYLRFRAVCVSWNQVCRDASHHPRIDPWLLLPGNPVDGAKFFSIPERNTQTIHLPCTTIFGSPWAPIGSSHGWLIYYNAASRSIQLLNPINGRQIQLPPVEHAAFSKAALIDVSERGFTVAAIYSRQKGFAVTCSRYQGWSSVQSKHRLTDVIKHKGHLYTVDIYGTVESWSEPPRVWSGEEIPRVDGSGRPSVCLVETPAGDLMRVERHCSSNHFSVSVLDETTLTWVQVDKIGEVAVFVGYGNSFCFTVRDHPGLRANCIYFIDSYQSLCIYNLEQKTKELVELGEHLVGAQNRRETFLWFVPALK